MTGTSVFQKMYLGKFTLIIPAVRSFSKHHSLCFWASARDSRWTKRACGGGAWVSVLHCKVCVKCCLIDDVI